MKNRFNAGSDQSLCCERTSESRRSITSMPLSSWSSSWSCWLACCWLWWACWLRCESLVGLLAWAESDWGCLWWFGGRLMPRSIPAGTHSPVCHPPALLSNRSLPSWWACGLSDLEELSRICILRDAARRHCPHFDLYSSGARTWPQKKTIFKGQFQLLHIVAHSWWNFSGLHGQLILDRFFLFWSPPTITFFQSLSLKIQTRYWY